MTTFKHRLVIGDWSDDGHGKCDYYSFECSHDATAVKKAYLKAIKKCKVALHDDGKTLKGAVSVCCDYEDSDIKDEQLKQLKDLGVEVDNIEGDYETGALHVSSKGIATLFFEMVKTQIADFTYKSVEEEKPLNGFWSKDFNHGFGYGCYT